MICKWQELSASLQVAVHCQKRSLENNLMDLPPGLEDIVSLDPSHWNALIYDLCALYLLFFDKS